MDNVLHPQGYFQSLSVEAQRAYLNAVQNAASYLRKHPDQAQQLFNQAGDALKTIPITAK